MSVYIGCLIANHEVVVMGEGLEKALWRMEELENLARVFHLALQSGTPVILSDDEMRSALAAIGNYCLVEKT